MRTRRFAPQPAILGGPPAFDAPVPIVKPKLPPWNDVVDDLKSAYGSGRLSNFGPYCCALEDRVRSHLGCKYAVAVSSGTIGLHVAVAGLASRRREVAVPSFSFAASLDSILANGRVPRFVDVDAETWNASPEQIAQGINRDTAAVLPVHVFGNPCDIGPIETFCREKRSQLFTMQRTPSGPHTEIVLLARTDCAACSA